ncbi:hypothetical protein N0V93_006360 [Gnomoniopsis smithogilvyi]|uniref:Rhodopsin domain-containing protein n=1 Tax=Gnomoniopsis smithogilvyi TaxID=1191159 RepID=A0A9W8YPP3_9PEZI|nr:hypothetical protein N0V93_006360 [Gnomoniopsis smithogilvyi]
MSRQIANIDTPQITQTPQSLHDQTIGLFVFFPVLCTVTLALRIYVRTKLCKGAFGWDDVALIITWTGLILWVGMAWTSVAVVYGSAEWLLYVDNKNYVCYIISGVVKISVALVLYRLDTRLWMHILLIADMIICATWTVVVTLIIGLGCTTHSPYVLSESVCEGANYAQELSYVIFNVLHVIIPVFIVWGVQVRGNLRWAVIALFSVGLLAVVAAVMKLKVYIEFYNPGPDTQIIILWYQSMIWAVAEHGLSLFAATILAVRPFFTFLVQWYESISNKMGYGSGSRQSVSNNSAFSRASKISNGPGSPRLTEMDTGIGMRHDLHDAGSDYDLEHNLEQSSEKGPTYQDVESTSPLPQVGSKRPAGVETGEVVR